MKTIGLASDHAGFELKEFVKQWLEQKGWEYKDFGTYSTASCDYPDFAHPLAEAVEAGECYLRKWRRNQHDPQQTPRNTRRTLLDPRHRPACPPAQ